MTADWRRKYSSGDTGLCFNHYPAIRVNYTFRESWPENCRNKDPPLVLGFPKQPVLLYLPGGSVVVVVVVVVVVDAAETGNMIVVCQ